MKKLLNTLYLLTEDTYLSLDGENVVILQGEQEKARFPLHGLEEIISFSYRGASPALMGACAEKNIALCFAKPNGKFLARVCGPVHGNVLLRQTQYRVVQEQKESLAIAQNMIVGKMFNSRWVLERATRDHPLSVDVEKLKKASMQISEMIHLAQHVDTVDSLRGIEGDAAAAYFGVFDQLILRKEDEWNFHGRFRRPPPDAVNALLSFAYALLTNNCSSALETVGLDPYLGVMHTVRPGRCSLSLDLMEELRSVIADRFVLSCINNRVINTSMFIHSESGAVSLTDEGRKAFLSAWQERKKEMLTHPFLNEKIQWGLVPYVQALLLARTLRGDLEAYPPFLWK